MNSWNSLYSHHNETKGDGVCAQLRFSRLPKLLIQTALVSSCFAFGTQLAPASAETLVAPAAASVTLKSSSAQDARISSQDVRKQSAAAANSAAATSTPTSAKQSVPEHVLVKATEKSADDAAVTTASFNTPGWVQNSDGSFSIRCADGSWTTSSWTKDADGWHYFDETGRAVNVWYKTPNGKWFFFETNGLHPTLKLGVCMSNGYPYWIDESQGLLYDGWIQNPDGSWMHTDQWGVLVSGWYQTPNGKWWYFSPNDHKLVTGDCFVNGYHYWIDVDRGLYYSGWIHNPDGSWMRTDQWGILASGWYRTPNYKWFYFDPQTFKAVIGACEVDGKTYYIDESKGLVYNCTVNIDGRRVHVNDQGIITENIQPRSYVNPALDPNAQQPANRLLRVATGEIGYRGDDDPEPGSKYGRWMADVTGIDWLRGPSRDIWWCAIFVSWCFDHAQVDWSALPSYNCDQILSRARSYGDATILDNPHDCRKGDVALYDFDGNGSCDHIGIIESNNGNTITAIEGNTHPDDNGSQNAGNGVWRRVRGFDVIRVVIRPNSLN